MKWHIDPTKLFLHNIFVCKKTKNSEQCYLNGKRHNPNGPAYLKWHDNGQLFWGAYYLNGKLHNLNGPAYREWYENGQLWCEQYYLNGKLHNPNGPAYREWYVNGKLRCEHYYLNDQLLSKDQFLARLNK